MLYSGKIIGSARRYYKINLRDLSYGVCTESHMARIEKGERSLEKLMFELLYQRIGKYSGRYELLVNYDEFVRYEARRDIQRYLDEKDFETSEKLIVDYKQNVNKILDLQLMVLLECELKYKTGSSICECKKMLMEGLQYTIPKFEIERFEQFYFSRIEMLMLQQYARFIELEGEEEQAIDLYRRILTYLEQERYDRSERAILYSYVGYLLTQYYIRKEEYDTALKLAQKAYDETLRAMTISFVIELKECINICRGKLGYDVEKEWQQIEILRQTLKKYGAKNVSDYFPRYIEENIFCVNDIIGQRRRMLGLSQEDLLEVCSTATISRAENRHRTLRDDKKSLLLKEVRMCSDTYIGMIDTESWEVYEWLNQINDSIIAYDADGAEKILNMLEMKYEFNTINSRQYIYSLREKINIMRTGETSQLVEEIEKLLEESLGEFRKQNLDGVILLQNEMQLLERIITRHKYEEEYEIAMSYLYSLANTYETYQMTGTYKYINVCRYIGDILGEAGNVEEADRYVIRGIKASVEADYFPYLTNLAYCYVWNVFNKKEEINHYDMSICKEMMELCYVHADIYKNEYTKSQIVQWKLQFGIESVVIL